MMMQSIRKRRHRGVSFLELMIAQGILATLMVGLMFLFVEMVRVERSNLARLNMAFQAAALHRELRQVAASPGVIAFNDVGDEFIRFERRVAGGARIVSELRFIDRDGNPNTIADNEIILVRNVDSNSTAGNTVVRYVSPIPGTPMFTRGQGIPAPILVNFRIGDTSRPENRLTNAQARRDDSLTGRGFNSMVFRGAYTPRNTGI